MSIFRKFPKKSLYEVSHILVNSRHESILNFIEETEDGYRLNNLIENISLVPAYQFAVACSLASLGNPEEADSIFKDPESVIDARSGNDISRDLLKAFMA